MRTHRLLQLALPVLAFLAACGETPNLRSTEVAGDSSTINGSIAASKAVDVDLEATMPVMRTQSTPLSTRLRAKTTVSTDAFNALLSLKGTFVVAVNANGQVLGSSPIADDGSFSVSTQKNQTVALMFANKGTSGAWVCQQPLEYNDGTGAQTAVLNPIGSQIQVGRFSFKAATGRASSSSNQASVTPVNDPRFSSDSLDGYQRCGNPNVEEIVVRGDYNITWPQGLNAKDPLRSFNRTMVLGLDTTAGGKPRFVGAGTVSSDGKLEIRVRHEAGSSLKLSPTIIDDRSLEPLSGPVVMMPTWNMGIPVSDVSQQADFGTIKAEIVVAEGELLAANQAPQVGASINASLESATKKGVIAQSQTVSGQPEQAGQGAAVKLLLPKPQDPDASFIMSVVSADGLETARDVLQPNKTSFSEPKRWTTQVQNGLRTHQFGSLENDSIRAMTLDAQQNLFVLGETSGAINGAGSNTFGGQDLFISKFAANGTLLWQTQFGSSETDLAQSLQIRSDGSILALSFKDTAKQVMLSKLDAGGGLMWNTAISIPNENLRISSLLQDESGNVYLAGQSDGLFRNTGMDAMVAMYSNASIDQNTILSIPTWFKTFTSAGSNSEEIRGMTFDSSRNLVMSGTTAGAFAAGLSVGKNDLFVAKFQAAELGKANAPGLPVIIQTGTTNDDEASAIAADSGGNVYVTGFTNGGSGTGPAHDSGFLQRFDASLNATWTSTLVTNDSSNAENLAVSVDQGSIYVTGKTSGPIGATVLAGATDMTVARFEGDGSRTWLKQFGTLTSDAGQAVVVRNGRVVVGGYTNDSLNRQVSIGKQDAVLIDFAVLGN